MSTFGRTFAVQRLDEQVLEGNPWFADLLRHWRPAGDVLYPQRSRQDPSRPGDTVSEQAPRHLRLAVRNGYLNFYRGGQSVARVEFGRNGGLQARIHNKYIYGEEGRGQAYVTLRSAGYLDINGQPCEYGGSDELDSWIDNATGYVGREKHFVDLVMAHSPNTIDLEMALPAYSFGSGDRVAPRMDLVALESVGQLWRVVFWEAKLVDDPRARCRGEDASPEVVRQLDRYSRWLGYGDHHVQVIAAYQNTCRLLVAFHHLARAVNPQIGELGVGIVKAAEEDAPPLLVDEQPRLLIDDRSSDVAFSKNGHLAKLRRSGQFVQMVRSNALMSLEVLA